MLPQSNLGITRSHNPLKTLQDTGMTCWVQHVSTFAHIPPKHSSNPKNSHLSSQYIVLMRYSCWMLSTGHRSVVISSSVRFCLFPMTRN